MNTNSNIITNKQTCKTDGLWQKRGHALLNVVVTVIVVDKWVEYQVSTKHSSGWRMWEAKENQPGYDLWKAKHICYINHTKSSWAIEAAGAIDIFNRSIDKNNLIFQEYIGDGDTSLFKEVADANPHEK